MKAGTTETGGVLVLHKALDILESIKQTPDGVKLSDLARAVDMPKATVYRILATLESRGFLDRGDNQENELDGRCIGAPVAGPEGRVVAALSISGPVFRMDLNRARSLAPKLKQACAAISAKAKQ
jgi:IclR family acetate operon transcriptional repressor